ncbi:MAG: type II toxin-antitoxin system VapC family toxin [Verrucomicrobia bacterium]|nr:type II toxin-antitoxin system VapC family toxin [Verrucomicrobiota bacterium]MCH8525934.1 type II toxin-antitoxin system VapC family toxin [Kiritimatiellia bacterium]
MDLIADTSFLVGLWRRQPWAMSFARENAGCSLGFPWVVLGEFWHGATRAGHDPARVRAFLDMGIPLLDPSPVIRVYARLCTELQDQGGYKKIGQNDLWIAAVAVEADLPLVSRNQRHFREIPNLELRVLDK